MVDSTAISGRIISILMLDQFSQRKKMGLELAHLMQPRAKPTELFLEVTTVLRCTVCKICVWYYSQLPLYRTGYNEITAYIEVNIFP